MKESKLVEFYSRNQPDSEGRLIDEIWTWNWHTLEYTHDYIQWLFPLPERSNFNSNAPILTSVDISRFKISAALQSNLLKSFNLMLSFYGFEIVDDENVTIRKSKEFKTRSTEWITSQNHNFLRITRILRSLTLLGMSQHAKAFMHALKELTEEATIISTTTLKYWREAVE